MATSDRPPNPHCDAEAWLRLCLVPGVSQAVRRKLLKALGSPDKVLASDPRQIEEAAGNSRAASLLARGPSPALLEKTMQWLDGEGRHLVALGDAEYPQAFLQIPDPPTVFYAIGRTELLNRACFAIVGSRSCTSTGGRDAYGMAQVLSNAGLCIVSGLALGIDAHAHAGGLEGPASTIAVMGTGPDVVYPKANRALAHRIASEGCLITEFPLGTHSLAANFPRRNRLISGLSRGVLVVEAAKQSGSLITARMALEQNRDVFALPGSIHSPHSKGCHLLIKEGAKLVDCADDILVDLGLAQQPSAAVEAEPELGEIDVRPHVVLNAIRFAPLTIDQISGVTGQAPGAVAAELSRLEVEGRIESIAGGRYQLDSGPSPQR